MGSPVPGVPHVPIVVHDEVVRARPLVQLVPLELPGPGVEVGQVIADLANEPDTILVVHVRIAWPRVLPRHRPLGNLDGLRSVNRCGTGEEQRREEQCREEFHGSPLINGVSETLYLT